MPLQHIQMHDKLSIKYCHTKTPSGATMLTFSEEAGNLTCNTLPQGHLSNCEPPMELSNINNITTLSVHLPWFTPEPQHPQFSTNQDAVSSTSFNNGTSNPHTSHVNEVFTQLYLECLELALRALTSPLIIQQPSTPSLDCCDLCAAGHEDIRCVKLLTVP
jgi:hypothetical protein